MTITLVAIARDENLYIKEWIEHHLSLGIDRIVVYDHKSIKPLKEEVFPNSKVSFIDWKETPIYPQLTAYTDALSVCSTDWIMFLDIDEFLTLDISLGEFLDIYSNVSAVHLCWQNYNASGQVAYSPEPVQKRFTQTCPEHSKFHGKYMVKPSAVTRLEVHTPVLAPSHNCVDTNLIIRYYHSRCPVYTNAYIKHYYTKSYEEWLWKLSRGSSDSRNLKNYNEFFLYNPDLKDLWRAEDVQRQVYKG